MVKWLLPVALALILKGMSVAHAAPVPPVAQPRGELPSCRETWSRLVPKGEHAYHYGADRTGDERYEDYAARVHRKECVKDWTVLVYMAADNDLAPYAYWDLYEMEAGYKSGRAEGGSTLKSDLVVQLDTPGATGLRRLHVFQSPEVYRQARARSEFEKVREADIRSPVVALLPEVRESEEERFRAFLEWGLETYPSRHVMVVVWGHGQGWTAAGSFGGIAFNDSQGSKLDIPALARVLGDVSRERLGGRPIDVYASDACLMQMVEVADEISGNARFVVGSTQVQGYLGLPYRRLMYELNTGRFAGEKGGDEPYLMARMIPKVFRAALDERGTHGRFDAQGARKVTMSALASEELRGSLLPALDRLGRAIGGYLAQDPMRAMDLQAMLQSAPTIEGGAQELGSFLTLLQQTAGRDSAELVAAVGEAQAALNRAVVAYALGTAYTSDAANQYYLLAFRALSAWLPVSPEDYANRAPDFAKSRFYRDAPAWGGWLKSVYGEPGRD